MNWEPAVFSAANAAAAGAWLLLLLFPRARVTDWLVHRLVLPAALAVLYGAVLAVSLPRAPEGSGFGSLDAVGLLFLNRGALLAGWIHYLAFDLFVGGWVARESERLGIGQLARAPALVLTFMFGPVGLLVFLAQRAQKGVKTGT